MRGNRYATNSDASGLNQSHLANFQSWESKVDPNRRETTRNALESDVGRLFSHAPTNKFQLKTDL
jgi:hypothetical protein